MNIHAIFRSQESELVLRYYKSKV